MLELNLGLNAEALGIGPKLAIGAVFLDYADRLENLEITPGNGLGNDTNLVDGGHEGRCAAVADRRFRTIKLDDDIVDAKAADGGKNMLGGTDQRSILVAQYGLEFGGGDSAHIGADLALVAALHAGADKNNAGIRLGGMQCQGNGKTGMDADSADGDLIPKRGLPTGFHSSVPRSAQGVLLWACPTRLVAMIWPSRKNGLSCLVPFVPRDESLCR
jgi:hypothetical protein